MAPGLIAEGYIRIILVLGVLTERPNLSLALLDL